MPLSKDTLQLLEVDGSLVPGPVYDQYWPYIDALPHDTLQHMYRTMAVIRALDIEAGNLQRQGQMALWVPAIGQEACQVGSAIASRPQDSIFPAYREHAVARLRGVSMLQIVRMLRGLTHGGWDPKTHNNFHLFTLVIGSHTLHATGYAMGIGLDGTVATGDVTTDEASIVYFGDGATSQGDTHEAMVFAQSYQAPVVFFLQNNHWAISTPVRVQSRTPLAQRAAGYGIPSRQIDGNDALISYAVTREMADQARSGSGPQFIEALTYRIGAHTTSDDPTKYRDEDELRFWTDRDPIARFGAFLRAQGEQQAFFDEVDQQGLDEVSDFRRDVLALGKPEPSEMFRHVYSAPHAPVEAQAAWFAEYEASFVDKGPGA
ncbi:MAG: 3-methyl-2-oxobutanoate dehydrogenase subunit alpha [Cellulomonadaceae bacterium TMED98]|nr:MAG: 3-methyl-2-oxobutanoate dehydrogenase subunit alpha [Cellulomonadaceae bacterium TMED98]